MPSTKSWLRSKPLRAIVLSFALLGVIFACSKSSEETIYQSQIFAFGTLVEISLFDIDSQQGDELSADLRNMMEDFHQHWHAWEPGALNTINQSLSQTGHSKIAQEDAELIEQALTLAKRSKGLFHPAIGKLSALWGFHSEETPTTPPSDSDIKEVLSLIPTLDKFNIEGDNISVASGKPIYFDLGGFAKGVIVDRVIETLREQGISNAIINAGGDLRAIGNAGNRPWRIGIRHPRDLGVFASLTIENDEAVFTSGDYERYFEYGGQRYHHILDPRSGYPASGIASVTIVHSDGATADAAATALFIAGIEQWKTVASSMGISHVMIIDVDNNVLITPELAQRMQYETDPLPKTTVVSLP